VPLNEAHRRAIGVRLESIGALLEELRLAGIDGRRIDDIEDGIREIEATTHAIRPKPPESVVQAALAQLWVLVLELRPRALRSHGTIDESTHAYLERESNRLAEHVKAIVEDRSAA
jgi:hypothetical protein